MKQPQIYEHSRKIQSNQPVLKDWFKGYLELVTKPEVNGDFIVNVDETPLSFGNSNSKVIVPADSTLTPVRESLEQQRNVTLTLCISLNGLAYPSHDDRILSHNSRGISNIRGVQYQTRSRKWLADL